MICRQKIYLKDLTGAYPGRKRMMNDMNGWPSSEANGQPFKDSCLSPRVNDKAKSFPRRHRSQKSFEEISPRFSPGFEIERNLEVFFLGV